MANKKEKTGVEQLAAQFSKVEDAQKPIVLAVLRATLTGYLAGSSVTKEAAQ